MGSYIIVQEQQERALEGGAAETGAAGGAAYGNTARMHAVTRNGWRDVAGSACAVRPACDG